MEDFPLLLAERIQLFIAASSLFFLFFLVAWRNGYFHFSRPENDFYRQLTGKIVIVSFALFLFLQLVVIPLTFQVIVSFFDGEFSIKKPLIPEMQAGLTVYGVVLGALLVALYFLLLPRQVKQIVLGSYGFKSIKTVVHDFYLAFLSWILSYPLVVAVGQSVAIVLMFTYGNVEPEQVAVKQIKLAARAPHLFVLLMIAVIFFVPMIEELLFRGFLQNWLKKRMSRTKAVLWTSFIFASFHFSSSQGMGNIELLISLFVLSCFLGFIYERQQSLAASISLHAIFNAVSLLMIYKTLL